jgi:hypothetical protein
MSLLLIFGGLTRAERSGFRSPARAGNFSLRHHVQTGFGAHKSPVQWVLGVLSPGLKQPGVKLTTHPYLAPRLRMC